MRKYLRLHISAISLLLLQISFCSQTSAQETDTTEVIEKPVDEEEDYGEDEVDREYFFVNKANREEPPSPVLRKVPAEKLEEMSGQDAFWYANTEFEKPKQELPRDYKPYTPLTQRDWFRTLLWLVIIGGFTAFLMIYLTGNRIGLFRRKAVTANTYDEEEQMPEDIFAINYQREIDKATSQGNYRMATRLMYLCLLKNLSDRGLIKYSQDKTNFDYLLQMHSTPYYSDFFRVTRDYEYSWYGKFDISERAFELIRKDFDHFENRITR